MAVISLLLLSIIAFGISEGRYHIKHDFTDLNFVATRTFKGRHEVRVAQNGVLGMEVTIPGLEETSLFIRIITDGKRVVKLIYSDKDTIETCEADKFDEDEVNFFLTKFLEKDTIHTDDLHIENVFTHLDQSSSDFISQLIHSHTKLTPKYGQLIDIHNLKEQCHKNHVTTKYNLKAYQKQQHEKEAMDSDEVNLLSSHNNKRMKRAPELIYPGTKWCGKGSNSLNYEDLGDARDEDRCCRDHDFCTYMIEGFTRKWGYFNPRITTISHCDCDDKFTSCLKVLNTQVADMIGDIYFNVIKTQCFVFQKSRECVKYKWWGGCAQEGDKWNVEVKEPISY